MRCDQNDAATQLTSHAIQISSKISLVLIITNFSTRTSQVQPVACRKSDVQNSPAHNDGANERVFGRLLWIMLLWLQPRGAFYWDLSRIDDMACRNAGS